MHRAAARDRGLGAHGPLLAAVVRRDAPCGAPRSELLRAGARGLIDVRVEGDRRTALAAAVLAEVRGRLRAWAAARTRAHEDEAAVSAAITQLGALHRRAPTAQEVAKATGIDLERVLDVLLARAARRLVRRSDAAQSPNE